MSELTHDERAELDMLRARVALLEQERTEQIATANAAVAAAQERTYWLDRWHLDLNAMMQRKGAAEFRWLLRAARKPVRIVRITKRKLLG